MDAKQAAGAACAAHELQKSVLYKIKLASSQKSRIKLLKLLTKEHIITTRKTRLFNEYQSQMNDYSPDVKIFLRKAFDTAAGETERYEENSPRSTDEYAEGISLDNRGVKIALREFGLGGESTQEKKVIENLCSELTMHGDVDFLTFACEAVPRAREEVQQLRRPALLQSFQFFDVDHSGFLDTEEVERIFVGMCLHNMTTDGRQRLRAAFEDIIAENSKETGSTHVTFDRFESLMEEMRERTNRIVSEDQAEIVLENTLSKEEMRLHSDELLSVYDVFKKVLNNLPSPGQCENAYNSNSLSADQLRYILMEFDIIPDSEEDWNFLVSQGWLSDMLALFHGRLPFKRVLQVVRNRREEIKLGRHIELRELLDKVDKDQSGSLNGQEVSRMLEMMGFSPKCREDQLRLKSLLKEVDADGSGCLDVYEFDTLVMRLLTRSKDAARIRFHQASHELGLTEKEELQMQALFYSLAGASDKGMTVTDISAARSVADRLQSKVSSDDLRGIVAKCSSNGQELDLSGFARVAVILAKSSDSKTGALQKLFHVAEQRRMTMMQDAESRRKSMAVQ
jgi:Ca2+-binding EF-hand superfamily protein